MSNSFVVDEFDDNFLFLIYQTNPIKQSVKIILDGEKKFYFSYKVFIDYLRKIIQNSEFVHSVIATLNEYGSFWLIDRGEETLHRIYYTAIDKSISKIKEIKKASTENAVTQPLDDIVDKLSKATIEKEGVVKI